MKVLNLNKFEFSTFVLLGDHNKSFILKNVRRYYDDLIHIEQLIGPVY